MNARRLTKLALLSAIALIIFIIELRIPNLIPIPGVKLGLANIITVYAVYCCSPGEVWLIVLVRLVLGSMFSGTAVSFMYSLAGAVFCLCGMLLLRHVIPQSHLWLASPCGAVCHNVGQITAAILLMRTTAILVYLPVLLFSGIIAGLFTGICAQLLGDRLPMS